MPDVATDACSRASSLVAPLCRPVEDFARFQELDAAQVPEPYRSLLDHHDHMTVVMERFHRQSLGLRVVARIDERADPRSRYTREILLVDARGEPVQHGIVRIDLAKVGPETAMRIRAAREPLGRVLIEAGLLRRVERVHLLRVDAGPRLAALLGIGHGVERVSYGRVADIALSGEAVPAVELLEIVAPPKSG